MDVFYNIFLKSLIYEVVALETADYEANDCLVSKWKDEVDNLDYVLFAYFVLH